MHFRVTTNSQVSIRVAWVLQAPHPELGWGGVGWAVGLSREKGIIEQPNMQDEQYSNKCVMCVDLLKMQGTISQRPMRYMLATI